MNKFESIFEDYLRKTQTLSQPNKIIIFSLKILQLLNEISNSDLHSSQTLINSRPTSTHRPRFYAPGHPACRIGEANNTFRERSQLNKYFPSFFFYHLSSRCYFAYN